MSMHHVGSETFFASESFAAAWHIADEPKRSRRRHQLVQDRDLGHRSLHHRSDLARATTSADPAEVQLREGTACISVLEEQPWALSQRAKKLLVVHHVNPFVQQLPASLLC